MLMTVGIVKLYFIRSLNTEMATMLWIIPTISGNKKNMPTCLDTDSSISISVVPSFLSISYLPLSLKDSLNILN